MRGRRGSPEVSLFPFLSVLCCIIGVMTLLFISVLSTRAVEFVEPRPEAPPETGDGRRVEDGIDAASHARFQREVERLGAVLAERQRERDELEQSIKELEDLVEHKQNLFVKVPSRKGRDGARLGEPEPVRVVREEGFAVRHRPILVEVKAEEFIVHPGKVAYARFRAVGAGPNKKDVPDPKLKEFLAATHKKRNEEYLVLLIHESGTQAFRSLAGYISDQHKGLEIGWEPFSREWEVLIEQQAKKAK